MTGTVPIMLERDNVNDESVTLVRWFVQHGQSVEAGALLAEIETSKANVEVYSPSAGFLAQAASEGSDIPVASAIGHIQEAPPQTQRPSAPSASTAIHSSSAYAPTVVSAGSNKEVEIVGDAHSASSHKFEFHSTTDYRQRISPLAAKMMQEHGLTSADFEGKSVIRKQDVLDILHPPRTAPLQSFEAARSGMPGTPITQPYKEVMLSKMKRREAATLAAGARNTISSYVSVTCFTQGLRSIIEARMQGGNASAVIAYEVSRLLRKYPSFNAVWHNGLMLEYEQVNIGYAMDDGRGLKVAVLPNCDQMSLQEVNAYLRELTVEYLEDKLTPARLVNATFTISDLSGRGVSGFLPLIPENQGAILGVASENFYPGDRHGAFVLTLAFDHQLSEGRTAALFLNDLKERLGAYEETTQERTARLACSRCSRTAEQILKSNHFLLRSYLPDEYVCTLCVAGFS